MLGQTQNPVTFSIKPNTTMVTKRNSTLKIFWQVKDELCLPSKWRLEVGTRNQTLLNYPSENMSAPIENYADYNVTVVRGACEGGVEKINVTVTIFVSEYVDIQEFIFCNIRIVRPSSNNTSKVHLVLFNEPLTTKPPTTTSKTKKVPPSPTDIPTVTTSSTAYCTKSLHHLILLTCMFLVSTLLLTL